MATRSAIASRPAVRLGAFEAIRRRPALAAVAGLVGLVAVFVAAVGLGEVPISPPDTVAILAHRLLGWPVAATWSPGAETIVVDIRLPRVLAAMAVGASLAMAGAAFQGLLRNPLADPYVIGTASGAGLGAAIGVLLPVRAVLLGFGLVDALAFVGALAAVMAVYRLSRAGQLGSLTGVLLTGYAVSSLLAAGLSVTMYLSGNNLRQIFFFLLGGLSGVSWEQLAVALPLVAIGGATLAGRGRALNGMLLGDEAAAHLGLDVARERAILLGAGSIVTAAAVALGGLIGFVGLVVPHVVRMLVGPDARLVLPLSAIYGAGFLALCDLLARVPGELPVGVLTALVGTPFFLYVLRQARGGYEL